MAPRKHQGRLEASVESRALHLATTEMKVVLKDHSEVLVCRHALAIAFDSSGFSPFSYFGHAGFK